MIINNVLAPLVYQGIAQETPLGEMIDTSFNVVFTTAASGTGQISIDTVVPFLLHSIYMYSPNGTVFIKPYDGEGNAIFTDFFLQNTVGYDPFPLLPPIPFRPNDLLKYDYLDTGGGGSTLEIVFRGFTIGGGGASAPGGVR